MEDFVSYLLGEYNLPDSVVCHKVVCSHATKNKIDKVSKVPITNHTITVKIQCFDKDHKKLANITEHFQDGSIKRPKTKPLINISPDELNNRFAKIKGEICNNIQREMMEKLNDLNTELSELKEYSGCEGVIPTEFVNEPKVTKEYESKKKFEF